ncbi:hypothetical protein [Streptomyces luteocolor]|uniref:hypothetical protein n=1 Tax=Streptomyces luteocolor TaxID=285500 RepID=UPI00085290A2|nr:hypothetical protein [Streptomyces luteocolor]
MSVSRTKSARALTLLAAGAVLATTVGAASASTVPGGGATARSAQEAPEQPVTSRLKGEGRLDYAVPQDDVRVSVDARATFRSKDWSLPVKSSGTFRIYHRSPSPDGGPDLVNWGDFKVDCLTTGGPTATVTGRLVRTGGTMDGWDDYLKRHVRMGVSFYAGDKESGAPARVGISGGTEKGEPLLSRCMAPAADSELVKGGYRIEDKAPAASR